MYGPCLYVSSAQSGGDTAIKLNIKRVDESIYKDETTVSRRKRSFDELVGYLYRECDFQYGCYLMTGTSLVPPGEFRLQIGDEV